MEFPSNLELRRVAHDLTMEFIRRNYPPRFEESVNQPEIPENLVAEYLKVYRIVQEHLLKG